MFLTQTLRLEILQMVIVLDVQKRTANHLVLVYKVKLDFLEIPNTYLEIS